MSTRTIGYTAEGHRIVVDEGPNRAGHASRGGELVRGDHGPYEKQRLADKRKAKRDDA